MSITMPLAAMDSKPTMFRAVNKGIPILLPSMLKFVFKGEMFALIRPPIVTALVAISAEMCHHGMKTEKMTTTITAKPAASPTQFILGNIRNTYLS